MKPTTVFSEKAPPPIGPYSQAVRVGPWVYVSGQIALDATGTEPKYSTITDETEQVMQNLSHVLYAAGADFSHVVKCTIFVRDLGDFAAINEIYGRYFGDTPPARETVEVSGLPRGVQVEISCVAYLPDQP